jgi:hypothetical protein
VFLLSNCEILYYFAKSLLFEYTSEDNTQISLNSIIEIFEQFILEAEYKVNNLRLLDESCFKYISSKESNYTNNYSDLNFEKFIIEKKIIKAKLYVGIAIILQSYTNDNLNKNNKNKKEM